jgi:hypothetical protein
LPLSEVIGNNGSGSPILIWATSNVSDLGGEQEDIVGRGLYSNFAGPSFNNLVTDVIDVTPPQDQNEQTGLLPDVMILDLSKPIIWPNGRKLEDSDLFGTVLTNLGLAPEALVATAASRNFQETFPYLGPPQNPGADVVVGNWVGWANPATTFQAPFDQVRFQVTFFEDGTAYWNDGHELRFGHGTGHGVWETEGAFGFVSTFVWVQFDQTGANPDGVGNIFKLRFTGEIDPSDPDSFKAANLNLTIFPPGSDALDPNDTGGIPVFGSFDVENCRRVKQSVPDLVDISGEAAGEFIHGAWWGKAIPAPDNLNPPFPEVVMMLTFTPDHNIIATDVFELVAPHVTAHGGNWIRTAPDNRVHGTFVWTNMTPETDYDGYAKVRLFGDIDPDGEGDLDYITGAVRPTGIATGGDVLQLPDTPFSGFLGQFNIAELTRIKVDPDIPTTVGQDYSANPATGTWIGTATADDPDNSPFPEIVIMPHFLPSGAILWNDSQEHNLPHGTGFGDWKPEGEAGDGVRAVGVVQKFDVTAANQFGGVIKIKYNGIVNAEDPNCMTGSVELIDFPAAAIPLPSPDRKKVFHADPDDTGGTSLGTFTFKVRRIENQPLPAPIASPPPIPSVVGDTYIHNIDLVGNWVGWAVPENLFQAPFDQVRFQATFFEDGSAYWNDGHELRFGHGTGHGAWRRVGDTGFLSTFYWIQFDENNTDSVGNIFKLEFRGQVNATNGSRDELTSSTLSLTIFPPGTDPLDPSNVGGIPVFGNFDVENARRVKQPIPDLVDISGAPTGEFVEGAWWGKAVPAPDNLNPPFPEVVMMLTFTPDHNIIATDVFELLSPHVTAHGGPWIRTAPDNRVHGTFIWTNMTAASDYNGYAKVRLFGDIDPEGAGDLDFMTGAVRPTGIATGADVLQFPDTPFSGFLGQFNIIELTRIKIDPDIPTAVGLDYNANPASGNWIGTATADDPSNSPFSEIAIMPHFLPSGSVIWNDSKESSLPHGTGFGDWKPTGDDGNGIEMVGVVQKMDVTVPNNFGGVIKIKYQGLVDVGDNDSMSGSFELIDFTAADIPLPSPDRKKVFHADPDDTGGESLGTFTYNLRRIKVSTKPGDMNADGAVNAFDLESFVLALTNPALFTETTGGDPSTGDINGDGQVNVFDIEPFVNVLNGSGGNEAVAQLQVASLKARIASIGGTPLPYEKWAAEQGLSSENNNPTADPNADGLVNLAAYAVGVPALLGSTETSLDIETKGEASTLRFTSPHYVTGVHIGIEVSSVLTSGAWTRGPDPVLVKSTAHENHYEVTIPRNGNAQFARLTFGETR